MGRECAAAKQRLDFFSHVDPEKRVRHEPSCWGAQALLLGFTAWRHGLWRLLPHHAA
jgi:hypothetical protein